MEVERFLRVILVIFCPVLLVLFPQPVLLAALFEIGQAADLILGPYATNATPSALNHPGRAVIASNHLFVADTRDNRVLIWNSIPTSNNAPADIVVGQPDFSANFSGGGPSGLNWPVGVYSDGCKLLVADSENYRVLIWNNIPTNNGAPADLVLGQPDFYTYERRTNDQSSTRWPWDVHYDGSRVYVVCTSGGRVLVWTNWPTVNNESADLVFGTQDFYQQGAGDLPNEHNMLTPRDLATDGQRLAVSDYNFKRILLWNQIPTNNGAPADVVLLQTNFTSYVTPTNVQFGHGGLWLNATNLYLAGNSCIYRWVGFPTNNNQQPTDYVQIDPSAGLCMGSGMWGVYYGGQHLLAVDCGASRLLIYNSFPPTNTYVPADIVLGQSSLTNNVYFERVGVRTTSDILSTGKKLFISMGADRRIVIHHDIPNVCEEEADNILGLSAFGALLPVPSSSDYISEPGQLWSDGIKLRAVDRLNGVLTWDQIPETDMEYPDHTFTPGLIEGEMPSGMWGMTVAGEKLFVSDYDNQRIFIWNTIPPDGSTNAPDVVLTLTNGTAYHLASDGQRLAAAALEGKVLIWNSIPTTNNTPPDIQLEGQPNPFNLPSGIQIFENQLFIADMGGDRICIYNTFPTNNMAPYDIVLGQTNLTETISGRSLTKMFMPQGISFDGEYLWVSEFKFGDRALRFTANIGTNSPMAPTNFAACPLSNRKIGLSWSNTATNEAYFTLHCETTGSGVTNTYYLPVNTTNVTMSGLTKNTSYSFALAAFNRFGGSAEIFAQTNTLNLTNHPPNIPSNSSPSNGASGVNESHLSLSWNGGDPDADDEVTYCIYFGTSTNQMLVPIESGFTVLFYNDSSALAGTTPYYWKIVATDQDGATTEGPVWNFQTCGLPGEHSTLSISNRPGGVTAPATGSYDFSKGASTWIRAYPSNFWSFSEWEGDFDSTQCNAHIVMDSNRNVCSVFQETLLTNGTPQLWLAQYGLETNNATALADSDGDGLFNWQEYIAGTNPTNISDRFVISSVLGKEQVIVVMPTRAGGLASCHTNRYYSLRERASLGAGGSWSNVIENRLGDNKECAFTNQGTCPAFYRGVVFVQ